MRPGQGQRRGGRRNDNRHGGGGQHRSGGQGHGGHGNGGQGGNQGQRSAMSLRNQIFDSNGPDMRVRGNAFQVHEKYQALAKDALSSGDRVLAENYLQHAEHYFRIIEAINEATAAEQRARQASWENQPQPNMQSNGNFDGNQQPQGERGMGEQGQDGQVQSEGRMERNPVQDLTQQDGQNGNQQQGNQGQQYQGQDGQQQQGGYQGNNQQRRNRDGGRDFNRDRNRNNRDGNRDMGRDGNVQGYGNQGGQPNQPHQQGYNQQPNTNQSADPLYDGVDEDGVDSPDTQAAVGGRR